MEFTNGPMAVYTKAIGTKIRYLAMGSIIGKMVELTREIGSTIICTVRVFINGKMAENTRESTSTIKSKAMESTPTQMEGATRVTG